MCLTDRICLIALHCADARLVQQDVERLDPRGRTPLQLAVCLGHLESTRVLLRRSADTTRNNAQGWTSKCSAVGLPVSMPSRMRREEEALTGIALWMCVSVLQEAVSTGDPELVQLVLQYRDFKRATERLAGIPELLSKLRRVRLLHKNYIFKPPGLNLLREATKQPRLKDFATYIFVSDFNSSECRVGISFYLFIRVTVCSQQRSSLTAPR